MRCRPGCKRCRSRKLTDSAGFASVSVGLQHRICRLFFVKNSLESSLLPKDAAPGWSFSGSTHNVATCGRPAFRTRSPKRIVFAIPNSQILDVSRQCRSLLNSTGICVGWRYVEFPARITVCAPLEDNAGVPMVRRNGNRSKRSKIQDPGSREAPNSKCQNGLVYS